MQQALLSFSLHSISSWAGHTLPAEPAPDGGGRDWSRGLLGKHRAWFVVASEAGAQRPPTGQHQATPGNKVVLSLQQPRAAGTGGERVSGRGCNGDGSWAGERKKGVWLLILHPSKAPKGLGATLACT